MKTKITSITMFLVFFVTGCAKFRCWQAIPFPDQSKVVENSEMGRIYVMRDTIFADQSQVRDKDLFVGILTAHYYLCWEREPGPALVSSYYGTKSELVLNVEKGGVYYIHEHSFWPAISLELINEKEGKERLGKCYPPQNVSK